MAASEQQVDHYINCSLHACRPCSNLTLRTKVALLTQAAGRAPDILELHVIDGPAKGQALPKPARFQTLLTVGRTKVRHTQTRLAASADVVPAY